jgi:hypothetical protein
VKRFRQLVGALLLAVVAGYPAMACLIPEAEMTDAERDCCKHMAQQCGSMNMPSSHSCCHTQVSHPDSMLGETFAHFLAPALSSAVVGELQPSHIVASQFFPFELHPPPESPPGTSSILRI